MSLTSWIMLDCRHIAEGKRQEQSYHSERGHSRVSDSEDYDSAVTDSSIFPVLASQPCDP
jgi:hypothetical protein